MADKTVSIDIQINQKGDGTAKASTALQSLSTATSEHAANAKTAAAHTTTLSKSFSAAASAANAFKAATRLMGIVGALGAIASAISKVRQSFREAAEQKKALEDKASLDELNRSIDKTAESWRQVTEQIAAARAETQSQLNLIEGRHAANARLQQAQIDLAEQQAIAAIAQDDPDRARKIESIQQDYAAKRSQNQLANASIALDLRRQTINADAEQDTKAADAADAQADKLREQIDRLHLEKIQYTTAATALNSSDATTVPAAAWKNFTDIITFNWGKIGDLKTAEGDAKRQEAAATAEKLQASIDRATEEIRRLESQADTLRASAKEKQNQANLTTIESQTIAIQRQTAQTADNTARQTRDHAASAEADRLQDAKNAALALQRQKANLESRIQEEENRKRLAAQNTWIAQNDLTTAQANRSGVSTAAQALQTAKENAWAVNRQADQTIRELTAVLQSVNARLAAAQAHIKASDKRQAAAWSEAAQGAP